MQTLKRWLMFFLILISIGFALILANCTTIKTQIISLLYDNKGVFLSYEEMPEESVTRQILEAHRSTVDLIKQVNSGFIDVETDTMNCPGKAVIVIHYPSHQNRLAIEKILRDGTWHLLRHSGMACELLTTICKEVSEGNIYQACLCTDHF